METYTKQKKSHRNKQDQVGTCPILGVYRPTKTTKYLTYKTHYFPQLALFQHKDTTTQEIQD